jgi:hypothetical protein
MWVVKIGGSLARSENLRLWLDVIARHGAGKVVLVPGGGLFADAVRDTQERWEFDDRTAHRMALLAMEQYGLMLCGLQPGLHPAGSFASIGSTLSRSLVPVWMPSTMVLADTALPESWDVTSDSLAAWLARELDASALVLVKFPRMPETKPNASPPDRRDWVDAAFGTITAGARYAIHVIGQGQEDFLAGLLDRRGEPESGAAKPLDA